MAARSPDLTTQPTDLTNEQQVLGRTVVTAVSHSPPELSDDEDSWNSTDTYNSASDDSDDSDDSGDLEISPPAISNIAGTMTEHYSAA
jgi:hypothetical protein